MAILIIVSRPKGSSGIAIPVEYIRSNQFDLAAGFAISLPDSKSLTLTSGVSKALTIKPSAGAILAVNFADIEQVIVSKIMPGSSSIRIANASPEYSQVSTKPDSLNVYHDKGASGKPASMSIIDKTVSNPVYHKFIGGAYAASC